MWVENGFNSLLSTVSRSFLLLLLGYKNKLIFLIPKMIDSLHFVLKEVLDCTGERRSESTHAFS